MATINLGRVKPVFQGAYSNSTAYVLDDMVTDSGNTYICIQAGTGNAVTDTAYWHKMAQGSDLGGLSGLTAGDIAIYNGSSWTRQAIGTAGQALKVNSGATGVEYGTAGGILQVKQAVKKDTQTISTAGTAVAITNLQCSLTPSSTSNKVLVRAMVNFGNADNAYNHGYLYRQINGGGYSVVSDAIGDADSTASRVTFSMQGYSGANQVWKTRLGGFEFLDSPNTTNQVDYKIYVTGYGSTTETTYINREENSSTGGFDGRTISTMTAFEIASGVL